MVKAMPILAFFVIMKPMTRLQFLWAAFWVAIESYFFSSALLDGQTFLAVFWGLLVLRNIQRAYRTEQLLKEVSKYLTKPPKK